MIKKEYNIYRSEVATFEGALDELLMAMTVADREILRITLFGAPSDNETYVSERDYFERRCAEHFGESRPMLSYVAQAPLRYTLAAEVTTISREDAAQVVRHDDYIRLGEEILSAGIYAPLGQDVPRTVGERARARARGRSRGPKGILCPLCSTGPAGP